MREEKRGKEN